MGELTREELAARLESMEARLESRMDARARATDSKIEALEAKMETRAIITDSKIEALEAKMEARASATDSKIEALEAKTETRASATDCKIGALENRIDARFAEFEARIQKSFTDLIKWMVGTSIAMMAVGLTFLIFLFGNFTPGKPAPIVNTVPSASVPAVPR